VKVNTDGDARGCPGFSACTSIFRDSSDEYISSFSSFLGVQKSLFAEVVGAILAIEHAWGKYFRVFSLSVTLPCFVKCLICLVSFLRL